MSLMVLDEKVQDCDSIFVGKTKVDNFLIRGFKVVMYPQHMRIFMIKYKYLKYLK